MAKKDENWNYSTNKDLEKTDNTTCGEIHTATEVIALICTGQEKKAELIKSAPKLLEALILISKQMTQLEYINGWDAEKERMVLKTIKKLTK